MRGIPAQVAASQNPPQILHLGRDAQWEAKLSHVDFCICLELQPTPLLLLVRLHRRKKKAKRTTFDWPKFHPIVIDILLHGLILPRLGSPPNLLGLI